MSAEIKVLTTDLRNDQCVIVLGPRFSFIPGKPPLLDGLAPYVEKEAGIQLKPDNDGLCLFEKKGQKGLVRSFMQSFSNKMGELTELHELFIQIPFHLVISLNPDKLLARAFEEKGIPHDFAFYNKASSDNQLPETPSKDRPLVYNLFGSFDEPRSLILDQIDLLDFIFSILSDQKPLPANLLTTIQRAQKLLFVGFEFDKWYLKLILKLLQLEEKDSSYAAVPSAEQLNGSREFFTKQFNLLFVEHESQEFVRDLQGAFDPKELRPIPDGEGETFQHKITELVKKDDLEKAIELLSEHFEEEEDDDLLDQSFLIHGRYNSMATKLEGDKLTSEEARVQRNKIRDSILSLAKKATSAE